MPSTWHELWRAGLLAWVRKSAANTAAARETFLAQTEGQPHTAFLSTLFLSVLGDVDTAYALAEGSMLHRGPYAADSSSGPMGKAGNWRNTHWLFTPAAAALRADARFPSLARDLGFVDYWKARGAAPDTLQGVSKGRLDL